ncbi:murein L,D-transpeptidase catalytic domain family protein [Henriciella aquimarina]|uniref:murein L,D-transpeptidase catalytic domain family protein n=1 Tax=Henriciella aquimarina TaxID=545261 RepID=UPI000A060349|nr:murein L,D-transpeptidase catalytic domain family protein [Henriciella aquimarina]
MTGITRLLLSAFIAITLPASFASAKTVRDMGSTARAVMGDSLWQEALAAHDAHADSITNDDYMIVIDYARPSGEARFFVIDMQEETAKAYLVSHGRNSDKNNDGIADAFSNVSGSKMTSLGTYVTAETYYGKHGLSLRLDGLEDSNDAARARAIVIHGADYVNASRAKMGRSWGCPALEQAVAADLIPKIAEGALIYTRGPGAEAQQFAQVDGKAG